jgi:DNA-binding MarR family transcriptional regulator
MVARGSCQWMSDEDVLAVICRLGAASDRERVRHAFAAGTFDPQDIDRCIDRLYRSGLVRFQHGRSHEPLLRLTALGIERLQALQRNPITARTTT